MSQQLTDVVNIDDILYVVECGCTNDWLSRFEEVETTGKPITIIDLEIEEEKCDVCDMHPWVILPLNHPTVVELSQAEQEIITLFQQIAEVEIEEATISTR